MGIEIEMGMELIDYRSFRWLAAYHELYTYRGICIEMYVVVVVCSGVYEYCVWRGDRKVRFIVVVDVDDDNDNDDNDDDDDVFKDTDEETKQRKKRNRKRKEHSVIMFIIFNCNFLCL